MNTVYQLCARVLCMRATASGGGWCCWWPPWLLKYNFYEILHRKERKVKVRISLRSSRPLRLKQKAANFQYM